MTDIGMIELAIKLPEENYERMRFMAEIGELNNPFLEAIANGTPLPKGHGEIVDIRPLIRGLYEEMCMGEETYTTSEIYKMLEEECQVIIEADKEGAE